jgi:methionine-gamma-lyase
VTSKDSNPAQFGFNTLANHAGREDLKDLGVHVAPIDFSSTAPLTDIENGGLSYEQLAGGGMLREGDSSVYRRLWNPTIARFEQALTALETKRMADAGHDVSGYETIAYASGMAAISAILVDIVRNGKPHVVAVHPIYGGTHSLLAKNTLGTEVSFVAPDQVSASITDRTGLVIVESPCNPTLELNDIADVVRQAGSVPVMVDNTFATPYLQQPLELGATYVVHSATKYLGGHGDLVGGTVTTVARLATPLRQLRASLGGVLDPLSGYLFLRGLSTLAVRMDAQSRNAAALAQHLVNRPELAEVYYPGLPGADPKGLVGSQMSGPGAMVSLNMAGGFDAAQALCRNLKLVVHAVSLGSTDTLIQHPASVTHRPVKGEFAPGAGVLRMSVGLENIEDLIADFDQALSKI